MNKIMLLPLLTIIVLNCQGKICNNMPNQAHKIKSLKPLVCRNTNVSPDDYQLDLANTHEVYPELVFAGSNGNPIGINYVEFIPILIQQIQKLHQRIDELENKNS